MFDLPPELVRLTLLQAAEVIRRYEEMDRQDQLRVRAIIHDLPLLSEGSAKDLLLVELARMLAGN
jgi:hypothetical protein